MFKRIFILLIIIFIYNKSFANNVPFQASILYPIIKDMENKYVLDIFENYNCGGVADSVEEFYFNWSDERTVRENLDNLSEAVFSIKEYQENPFELNKVQSNSRLKRFAFPKLHIPTSKSIRNFHKLSHTGKGIICKIIRKKSLIIYNEINIKKNNIPDNLQEYIKEFHPIPESYHDGFIQTLNNTGDEVSIITSIINKFLFAVPGKIVYDVGSGFGINTKRALEKGAKQVVAIDFSTEQLQTVITRSPRDKVDNLFILKGKIPEIFENNIENQADIILLSHVLHYLNPTEAEYALIGINKILKKGGTLYIQALTYKAAPYTENYNKNKMLLYLELFKRQDEYEKSVASGNKYNTWPTYIDSANDSLTMIHPQYLPALIEACKRNGFKILETETYNLINGQKNESGDAIGIIAIKE
nr:hypothetical protein GTC16762_32040 [Pigmentibacter ruber]